MESETRRACSTHGWKKERIYHFGLKTLRDESEKRESFCWARTWIQESLMARSSGHCDGQSGCITAGNMQIN